MSIRFTNVRGHIEVWRGSEFLFSADTESEARRELREEGYDPTFF